MIHASHASLCWSTSPMHHELCAAVEARVRQWIERGEPVEDGIWIVKAGAHRRVLRMDVNGQIVYLKVQPSGTIWKRFLGLFRRPAGEREFIAYQKLSVVGIPTPMAIAWGHQRIAGGMTSYFLTREVPDAFSLDVLTSDDGHPFSTAVSECPALRRELIWQLASLTARLHAAGLLHSDFHAGNLLASWRADQPAKLRVVLIDLAPIRRTRRLSLKSRLSNLAMLAHTFSKIMLPIDALRFFRGYYETCALVGADASPEFSRRELLRASNRRVVHNCWGALAKADRKWARGNRRLVIKKSGLYQARGLAELKAFGLKKLFAQPELLLERISEQDVRKRSADRMVVRTNWPEVGGEKNVFTRPIFVKRLISSPLRHLGCVCLGIYPRSRRTWEFGHAMLRRGIQTPKPLLYVERRTGETMFSSVEETLVTEEASGLVPLAPFVRNILPRFHEARQRCWRKRYARKLGEALAKFHAAGFDHRDLKGMNLLVAEDINATNYAILDLDAVRRWPLTPRFVRHKNLARLLASLQTCAQVSASDALRCLRAYRLTQVRLELVEAVPAREDRDWKSAWRSIARCVDEYHARQARPLELRAVVDPPTCVRGKAA